MYDVKACEVLRSRRDMSPGWMDRPTPRAATVLRYAVLRSKWKAWEAVISSRSASSRAAGSMSQNSLMCLYPGEILPETHDSPDSCHAPAARRQKAETRVVARMSPHYHSREPLLGRASERQAMHCADGGRVFRLFEAQGDHRRRWLAGQAVIRRS
jgi:hypothetical protein